MRDCGNKTRKAINELWTTMDKGIFIVLGTTGKFVWNIALSCSTEHQETRTFTRQPSPSIRHYILTLGLAQGG